MLQSVWSMLGNKRKAAPMPIAIIPGARRLREDIVRPKCHETKSKQPSAAALGCQPRLYAVNLQFFFTIYTESSSFTSIRSVV